MNEVKIDMSPQNENDDYNDLFDTANEYSNEEENGYIMNTINLENNSETSQDDIKCRKYTIQRWDRNSEKFLKDLCDTIDEKIENHGKNGKKYKYLHYTFGFFSTLLPLVSSGFINIINDELFEAKLLILIGVVNTISQFFRLETLHNKNLEYENRFIELRTKIIVELTKSKLSRTNCDLFLTEITNQYNFLNYTSPN